MRYVAKTLSDRTVHLADDPHTRSYCRKLRGALVVIDPTYASERIADRTVTVCRGCRTVLDDRRAAERAMRDAFMITESAGPARPRPVVEQVLFDLGDAEALPVVGLEAVTAAGIPVVDVEAAAEGAASLPEGETDAAETSSLLSGARQAGAAVDGCRGIAGGSRGTSGPGNATAGRVRPSAEEGWEAGRPAERAAVLKGWVTSADAENYAARFPECVKVRDRFERYEGEFRRSPMLSTVHVSGVEFPARWTFDGDEGGISITLPDGTTERGHWGGIVRTVRAYVLAHRPENVVAVGEIHEREEKIHAARKAEHIREEAAGLRALDAVRTDANRARAAFEALRPALSYQIDEAEEAVYEAVRAAAENAAECERVGQNRANTYRWWLGLSGYAEAVRRAADWLARGAERVGAAMPEVPAVVSVAPDAAPCDPGTADTWEGEGGAVPGVDTPRGPQSGATAAELGPVPGPGGGASVADTEPFIATGVPAVDAVPAATVGPVVGAPTSGVWPPQAAALMAETAIAHGWTVAMERHPSGAVAVRAAEVMAGPNGPVLGEIVAVWVDGVYNADRSAAYAGPGMVDVAPALKRALATVGRAAKAGEIITARPGLWADAPAPAGVSDPGTAAPGAVMAEVHHQADGEMAAGGGANSAEIDARTSQQGVSAPSPVAVAVAVMPIDGAKPAGRGDCAAANTCGGFGVLLWDVPGCAPRCAECAARVMGHSSAALRALTLPRDVVEEELEAADVVIRHTHEDGTTVEGSAKGDGVWEALRPLGWAYRRTPGIFLRGSRYKGADRWKINRAADAVRALGLSCAVAIEETMSFAEREAARVDAAEERTERFTDRAGRAAESSQAARDASDRIGERFWMGQPILVGHHSEGRARRDQERMHNAMRKSIAEGERAGYWASRAAAADAYERYRKNPGRTLRRIEKLEAERRGVLRERDGVDDKGRRADVWRAEPSEARREELTRRLAEYDEELTYWAETIKEAERRGFKVWGKPDFVRGDFARWRGTWWLRTSRLAPGERVRWPQLAILGARRERADWPHLSEGRVGRRPPVQPCRRSRNSPAG
jgi:hypothetical protein